ncbi:efflux RND transporter periplasmic adaptor subunit [Gynuella sp.]|uniref:efflux RND transporter periplasmic adaptor subunit n=1 Tax=Gynuella sp. TaxID=2969146 RepID=UPI003D11C1C4
MKHIKNIAIMVAGLVIGVLILAVMGASRSPVGQAVEVDDGTAAYYINLQPLNIRPYVVAYGTVQPTTELEISAETSGTVSYVHPNLKKGQVLPAGTVVLTIDPTDIRLSLVQAKANLKAKQISRQQAELEKENLQSNLNAAKQTLALQQKEFKRLENLAQNGNVSSSALDSQRQVILSTRTEVSNAELQLALVPSNLEMIDAEIDNLKSVVEQKQRDLERTEITLQADRRIGEVSVSAGSYVAVGSKLFSVSSPYDYEVEAKLSDTQFVQNLGRDTGFADMTATVRPSETSAKNAVPAQPLRLSEGFDTTTRMLGIVVGFNVEVPVSLKGLYTAVTIRAPLRNYWVVPRSAIHQRQVYLVGDDDTLLIEPVDILFYQGDYAVLAQSPSHHKVIVSSLAPAVAGMKIAGTEQRSVFQAMSDTLTRQ